MAYGSIVLEITNHVETTDKHARLTGVWSVDDENKGWVWGRRTVPAGLEGDTRYLTYLGGHSDGLLDGTKKEHWQSGVISSVDYHDIAQYSGGSYTTRTPRYSTGEYSIHWDRRSLYSDYSVSDIADTTSGSRNELVLHSDVLHGTVTAAMYIRDSSARTHVFKQFELVDNFTGVISSGARVDPGDFSSINWALVETRKPEMLIDGDTLYFNDEYFQSIGINDTALDNVQGSWESKGAGLEDGRTLFLERFPVNASSVRLVSVDSSGTVTEWTEQDNLDFSQAADQHYSVNYDLGTIETGGRQAEELVVAADIGLADTEITVKSSPRMDSWPNQGILVIGSEKIQYLSRTETEFLECIRGFDSTTPALHAAGEIVSDVQHGASTEDIWYVRYEAVPRVEYEVTDYGIRSSNYTGWLDVHPVRHSKSNKLVQIVSQDVNVARIVLGVDKPVIGGNLFGPIYYGTDTARLTATVYDSEDNPVDDVEANITIVSGSGVLNGSASSYTDTTNPKGQINCAYTNPFDQDSVDVEVTAVRHVGPDTEMDCSFSTAVTTNEAWVFQILKHDHITGTVGNSATAFSSGVAAPPYGLSYIDVWVVYTEDYDGGLLRLQDTSGIIRNYTIAKAMKSVDGFGEHFTRFFLAEAVGAGYVGASSPVWLFSPVDVEWNSTLLNGTRVILYEWSTGAQHPLTGVAGAYMPVRPDEISGNTLIFRNRLLPIPDPVDATNNLGGYIVMAPSETRFRAWARDPYSGNIIDSNDIRLKTLLPNSLTGVDETGALPIPYGFTLVTESFNIGSGIGGANFITVNGRAEGIHRFGITGSF